jgi:predicted RNase H-like HicB family nuclease
MKDFLVLVESGKRNFAAYLPDLPGCVATGRTFAELEANMRTAVEWHVQAMREHGEAAEAPGELVFQMVADRDRSDSAE